MKCISGKIIIALVALGLISCQSSPQDPVNHVVLCWLNDKSENTKINFLNAVDSLKSIPGIKSVSYGELVSSSEPVADNSFDVGFIITFEDKAALDAYLVHPAHVKAVKEVLKPSLRKVIVYDFKSN